MRSTRTRSVDPASAPNRLLCTLAFSTLLVLTPSPASAMVAAPSGLQQQQQQLKQDSPAIEVVVRRGAGVRPGVVRPGGWIRPAHYHWRPGGAIAAGAAIGFVAAASAAAYAGAPPAPGCCWYYTDPSQTQGFWDVCP